MNTDSARQLWLQLREHALVDGDPPALPTGLSPWYVRVMMGIAGWIGALFLLGFVGTAFYWVMRGATASLTVGALLCVAALLFFRAARAGDFGAQFGLAISIAGQGLVIIGLFNVFESESPILYAAIALFEAALVWTMPNFMHRFLSSWAAMLALALSFDAFGLSGLASGIAAAAVAFIWLHETTWLAKDAFWRPLGYGMTIALLQIDAMLLAPADAWWLPVTPSANWFFQYVHIIDALIVGAVLLMTALRLLARSGSSLTSRAATAAIVACVAIAVLSAFAPGLAGALLVLVLGFAAGNRVLIGIAIVALLGFVSHYYYQLETTLLMKSAILAASGCILLAARLTIQHLFFDSSQEGQPDA